MPYLIFEVIIGPLGAVLRVEPQQEGTTVAWSRSHPQGTRELSKHHNNY